MNQNSIRPIPSKYGVGFFSMEKVDLPSCQLEGFRYEKVGRCHNYHATVDACDWPLLYHTDLECIIDGFSPNLNKKFHIGHLRNLLIAASLQKLLSLPRYNADAKFVAMLGASLGVTQAGWDDWAHWTGCVDYHPKEYYDVALPNDIVETYKEPIPGRFSVGELEEMEAAAPEYWDGPRGPVIVKRGDGTPLYAYHDLAFMKLVGPTHYITGDEQREHFINLGIQDRHLRMGLVLGTDGKKMKSRTGDSVKIQEAIDMVQESLNQTEHREDLAWNILVGNLLQCTRSSNVKFDPQTWADPNGMGLYINYTYARLLSALKAYKPITTPYYRPEKQIDADLHFWSSMSHYFIHRAVTQLDPAPVVHYLHDLAKVATTAYYEELIGDGRPAFRHAIDMVAYTMECCMDLLGMKPLPRI